MTLRTIRCPLRIKFILASVLVEIIMLGILLGNSLRIINNTIEAQTLERIGAINPLLDTALSVSFFERDYATLSEILNKLVDSPRHEFLYIAIIDRFGHTYAQVGDEKLGDHFHQGKGLHDALKAHHHDGEVPLRIANEKIGFVRYGLSVSSFLSAKEQLLKQGALIAFVEVLLTTLLLGICGYFLTRHLDVLLRGMRDISEHKYNSEIQIQTQDEIGQLADGFNEMAKTICERVEALNEEKERAEVTLKSIGDAVITTDAKGYIEYLNPVAEQLTGWSTAEVKGWELPKVFNVYDELTGNSMENPVDRCLRVNNTVELSSHTKLIHRYGEEFAIEDSAAPIRDHQDQIVGVVLVFHDVSKARKMSNQLSWQARHDALTGLINRREFESKVTHAIASAGEGHKAHALFYLDLDQFKVVNDTCGHVAGDELLRQLSDLLQKDLRETDTLARLGGDEFGVLLAHCPLKQALRVADKMRTALEEYRFLWKENAFTIGGSIGVVAITSPASNINELMSAADVACYTAKDAGRNRVHVYEPDNKELVVRHGEMHWVAQIRQALAEDRFQLYCQPFVAIHDDQQGIDHYELLLRMQDENGQVIQPMAFLPAAERYNIMPELDRWVVNRALTRMRDNPLEKASIISINLSGHSLSDCSFLDYVINKFEHTQVNPEHICFEITETSAILNLSHAMAFIAALRKLGCKFSLDDFGSGLSSFQYLKDLEVDYLKIDGAFVSDMVDDPIDRAFVEAINQVGHTMNIKTIAEYVESEAIMKQLASINVDYAQGYFIAEPSRFENLS